jgi:hypothetical protein
MPNCQQAISVLLSVALVVTSTGVEGCKKSAQPSGGASESTSQEKAPEATYAVPTADQLYQLVAPIALFPDNLVAQVLAGSTFPDEITAAWQWLQQNSGLKDQQLMQAVDQQPWDASVKGLTQFSDVLQQMATNLSWTSALGDAYFNVPQSVMNAVQVMRQKAYQAGNLKTGPQQNVSVENQAPGAAPAPAPASSGGAQVTVVQAPPQTIVIQPSQPEVVYVPTYNPTTVYGAPVPAYPGYSTGAMVATSLLSFGVGIAVGAAMSNNGCCGWGYNSWGCGWHNSSVTYNRNVYVSNSNTFVNRNNYYANNNINRNNINTNNINRNNINTNNINRNNVNANNINRNNLNANNVNRNNVNANNLNRAGANPNNRANNFGGTEPRFNQKYNQPQFNQAGAQQLRNENAGNLAQQRGANQPGVGQNRAASQPTAQRPGNLNQAQAGQQRPSNLGQGQAAQQRPANQAGAGNFNQNQRQPQRGYGEQPTRGSSSAALGNYSQGGNARTNSARGQQSLNGGGGGGARAGGGGGAAREGRGRGR